MKNLCLNSIRNHSGESPDEPPYPASPAERSAWDRWWSLHEEEPIGQDTRMASAAAQQL